MPSYADFEPNEHIIKLPGRGNAPPSDYLPVKDRIIWFRKEHQTGTIKTNLIFRGPIAVAVQAMKADKWGKQKLQFDHTEEIEGFIFKATVFSADGRFLSEDYAVETLNDFGDAAEKCSTKAIGRALALAGFGTSGAVEFNEIDTEGNMSLPDAPVEETVRKFKPKDAPKEAPKSTPDPVAGAELTCSDCGKPITGYNVNGKAVSAEQVKATTLKMWNKPLCRVCHVQATTAQQATDKPKQVSLLQESSDTASGPAE